MIFYFSGTGNCKHVADIISKEINEEMMDVSKCMNEGKYNFELRPKEKLGFVFPTYFAGTPTIIREFIEKIKITNYNNNYIFGISTYGTTSGAAQKMLEKMLNKQGIQLNAKYGVKTVDNWTPVYNVSDENRNKQKLDVADKSIDKIVSQIKLQKNGDFVKDKLPFGVCSIMNKAGYSIYKTKKFEVDKATCIGCGICAKNCPSNAINMKDQKPVWVKDRCNMCLACLHHCPKFAIQYGNTTEKHGQYYYEKYNK